jgi:hypothetical protein
MTQELTYPINNEQPTFPYSVKVEQTAKGARVSVHCYNQHLELAVKESIEAYVKVRRDLVSAGLKVAPEE